MMSDIAYPGGPEITRGDYGASIPVRSGPRTEGDDLCQYAVGSWVADYMRQGRILGRLNAYEGDNIWTDVLYEILTDDEYEAAPDSMDRFTHDDIDYRYEPSRGQWVTL